MITIKDKVKVLVPDNQMLKGPCEGIVTKMELCEDRETVEYYVEHDCGALHWFYENQLEKITEVKDMRRITDRGSVPCDTQGCPKFRFSRVSGCKADPDPNTIKCNGYMPLP
jgi:hypothetical protein